MTDLEKAREALAFRLGSLARPESGMLRAADGAVEAVEDLIRAVFAEMRAAEVPEPQSVAEPVKRMMRARGYDGMSYATTINTLAHHYDTEHEESEWCRKLGCKPFVEAEPETPAPDAEIVPDMRNDRELALWNAGFAEGVRQQSEERAKKRTVSAEARKKILAALPYLSYSHDTTADRIIAIIEADGADVTP